MRHLIVNKIPCGLFCGVSPNSDLSNVARILKNMGVNLTCVCFVNSSYSEKSNLDKELQIPVVMIDELSAFKNKPSLVFCFEGGHHLIFHDYFRRLGIGMLLALPFVDNMEMIYNFYITNLDKLYTAHEMLADEESKSAFRASIKGKLTRNIDDFRIAPEPQYFLEGFFPTEGDIAIDGGAYDGATARDFAMQGAKVYAFEMDTNNYNNCLAPAEKYGFTIENFGLSNSEGEEFYTPNGTSSSKNNRGGLLVGLRTWTPM